jgi:hypothetical protein
VTEREEEEEDGEEGVAAGRLRNQTELATQVEAMDAVIGDSRAETASEREASTVTHTR